MPPPVRYRGYRAKVVKPVQNFRPIQKVKVVKPAPKRVIPQWRSARDTNVNPQTGMTNANPVSTQTTAAVPQWKSARDVNVSPNTGVPYGAYNPALQPYYDRQTENAYYRQMQTYGPGLGLSQQQIAGTAPRTKFPVASKIIPKSASSINPNSVRGLASRYRQAGGFGGEVLRKQTNDVLSYQAPPETTPGAAATGGGYGGYDYYPYYGGGGGYSYGSSPFTEYRAGYPMAGVAAPTPPVMRAVLQQQPNYANNTTVYPTRWQQLLTSWRI